MSDSSSRHYLHHNVCAFCATRKAVDGQTALKYVAKNIEEDRAARDELLEKLVATPGRSSYRYRW